MRKMMVNGEERDVVQLPFEVKVEPWAEYELLDGGRLRVRTVLLRVFQLIDPTGKPELTPEGEPSVIVQTQTVSVVWAR